MFASIQRTRASSHALSARTSAVWLVRSAASRSFPPAVRVSKENDFFGERWDVLPRTSMPMRPV